MGCCLIPSEKELFSSIKFFIRRLCSNENVFYALQEEPVIIKRKIELQYKVFGKKRSEDSTMHAGSLVVSAVFHPIESVGKSGEVTSQLDIRSKM